MRTLHVIESLAPGGIETTFLHVLRAWRAAAPWATHHVLAFAGGALEAAYREAVDGVTVAASLELLQSFETSLAMSMALSMAFSVS